MTPDYRSPDSSASGSSRPKMRAALVFIFITLVLDMLALGMIVPVLPKLVEDFVRGDTARAAYIVGVFGTLWALMQFVFSPVLGALSDRYGRRPVVLISSFGLGLDYLVMALAPSVWWLLVGRVISGITAASFSTASAYVADVTPAEKRAGAFGMLSAAFGLGFVLGPALGGVFGQINPRLPFWIAAALSLLNAMYGLFVLPESLPPDSRVAFAWHRANPVGSIRLLRANVELFGLSVVTFISFVAHEALPTTFVLYAMYRYHWDARMVGVAIATVGVISSLVGAGMVQPLVAKFGERRVLLAGLWFNVAGFITYGLAPTGLFFLAAIPIGGMGGLSGPPMQGLMTRQVEATEQGQLQGALGSIRGVAFMIGPVLFSAVFASVIDPHRRWHLPGAAYLLAAVLVMISAIVAWRVTTEAPEVVPVPELAGP